MSTTTDEAIIESSFEGDDAALQALADRYEEQGDPARAELVRVQATLDGGMINHAAEMSLYDRERELLAQHQDEWLAPLPHLPGITYEFTRGLPRAVAQDGDALRRGVQELAKCPEVRAVRLKRLSGVDTLVECESLSHFKSFSLERTRRNTRTLSLLANCPHLAGLTELGLSGIRLAHEDFMAIRQAAWRQNITRLDLSRAVSKENASCAMCLTNDLPRLRDLDVTANDLPEWAFWSLGKPEGSTGLTTLRLRACGLRAGSVWQHLAPSAHLSELATLDLSYNHITSDGAMAIVESKRLRKLRRLKLTCCDVGPYGLNRLWDRFGDGVVVV